MTFRNVLLGLVRAARQLDNLNRKYSGMGFPPIRNTAEETLYCLGWDETHIYLGTKDETLAFIDRYLEEQHDNRERA